MVRFITLLPIAIASRLKRQTNQTITIDNISDAFEHLAPSYYADHGCHCARVSSGSGFGGEPLGDADRSCKHWNSARLCLELSGGVCENSPISYVYPDDANCDNLEDACQRALCNLDQYYGQKLSYSVDTPTPVTNSTLCILNTQTPEYDSCCGTGPGFYEKFDSEIQWCYNNATQSVVITENCEPGEQKNADTDTCEPCPPDNYSNGRGRCVSCNQVADIIIQYDGSGSMKKDENGNIRGGSHPDSKWSKQKEFVKDLVDNFFIGPDNVRVAAFQYNEELYNQNGRGWSLSDGDDVVEVNEKTDTIIHHNEQSCSYCSQVAKGYGRFKNIFNASPRADAQKVVLSLADGINGMDRDNNEQTLRDGMNWLKNNDVETFFISIGAGAINGERPWNELVNREDNFIRSGADGWSGLSHVVTKILNKICAANAVLSDSV